MLAEMVWGRGLEDDETRCIRMLLQVLLLVNNNYLSSDVGLSELGSSLQTHKEAKKIGSRLQ